ncbi:DUF2705 family protein [Sutcliffiella horikoshii]|uniref:DUF2705 family protein n=1 Tax=Sutcliffiella horikoshii TaxID=79883 RepID=UPI00384F92AD
MFKSKYSLVLMMVLLTIYSILWAFLNRDESLLVLYGGVPFDGEWYVYLLNYFMFSGYVFFVFKKNDNYVNGYGIYVVLRFQSKMKIIIRIIINTMYYVFIFELFKLCIYTIVLLVINKQVFIENYFTFINMISINLFLLFLFLFVQIILELFWDSKIALVLMQSSYLLLLSLGSVVRMVIGDSYLNLLILPNVLMYERLKSFYTFDWINMVFIYLFLIVIFITLILIVKVLINKKDWLERV